MAEVQRLADAEMRSRANMMKILIMEDVAARGRQRTRTIKEGGKHGEQTNRR